MFDILLEDGWEITNFFDSFDKLKRGCLNFLKDLKAASRKESRLVQDAKVMVVVKNALEKTVAKVEDYRERLKASDLHLEDARFQAQNYCERL